MTTKRRLKMTKTTENGLMYRTVTDKAAWKNKHSVEEIDYSILLTHVFRKSIRSEQAFMYLFRRYGLPNESYDDYKDLCSYSFHTKDRDIIVRWVIATGDHHHHLCAFADTKDYAEYRHVPIANYHKAIQQAAEKDGLVYFGGSPWSIFDIRDGKTVFAGTKTQEEALNKILKERSCADSGEVGEVRSKVFDWLHDSDKEIRERYKSTIAYPKIESQYGQEFCCGYSRQTEGGKQQHDWIMSLPESHFLRRVYFASADLFEEWKRPTYIRDTYFNLTCEEEAYCKGNDAGYTDYMRMKEGGTDAAE
jgi:hypothetical protein